MEGKTERHAKYNQFTSQLEKDTDKNVEELFEGKKKKTEGQKIYTYIYSYETLNLIFVLNWNSFSSKKKGCGSAGRVFT